MGGRNRSQETCESAGQAYIVAKRFYLKKKNIGKQRLIPKNCPHTSTCVTSHVYT